MAKIKKEKPLEVVETLVEESVAPVESGTKAELKRIYAAAKSQNPELYAAKNKEEELQRRLAKL